MHKVKKGLGFAQGNQMKLYGEEFELVSEPIVMADNLVVVDAIEHEVRAVGDVSAYRYQHLENGIWRE